MGVEPTLSDSEIPSYIVYETTKNIVKRYGTLKFWTRLNGFDHVTVRELLYGKTKGNLLGSKAHKVKQRMVEEGLWVEPNKKKRAAR
jgi:hypothetical protein